MTSENPQQQPQPRSRRARAAAAVVAVVVLGLAVAGYLAYFRDFRLAVVRAPPAAEPGPPLDFRPRPGGERLAADFPAGARPTNVVLIVGDGMGFSQLAAARAEYAGVAGRLFIERLPFSGWVTTYSLDDLYTDSAAAATAFATGVKTRTAMLSRTPDGRSHPTVLELGLARGMRAGLITTTTVLDATPAAFVAHVDSRRDYAEIAAQMAASGVELLVGEALTADTPERRAAAPRLRPIFTAAGYRWVASWAALTGALAGDGGPPGPPGKVIAQLPAGTLATSGRTVPLVDVAALALARLAGASGGVGGGGRGRGFFLLVEDEDADTGSHQADLPRVTAAVHALDQVAELAVDFARGDGATLVLVTADHETGGLIYTGGAAGGPAAYFWATSGHTGSPVPIFAYGPGAERFTGVLDNTDVALLLADLLGLDLPAGYAPRR